jgi:hypothetical protein
MSLELLEWAADCDATVAQAVSTMTLSANPSTPMQGQADLSTATVTKIKVTNEKVSLIASSVLQSRLRAHSPCLKVGEADDSLPAGL